MPPIRILIADDHFVVRSGIIASLDMEDDMNVVAEAEDERAVLEQFRKTKPDVVLMDLRLANGSGIDAAALLNAEPGGARVLMFTTFDGDEQIYRAMQAGARGYLLKSAPRDELLEAIRAVSRGERFLPSAIAHRLADRVAGDELSPREIEVLRLIAAGKSNKEIASALGISDETVKRHVSNVFAKLKVSDRAQATAEAIRRGVIAV
jgi:RNA polymerase sigma factor (sigma-70 family)